MSASTGDFETTGIYGEEIEGVYVDYPRDFNLTSSAELSNSDSTTAPAVAESTPDTTPAAIPLQDVTKEIPAGISELTCEANCVTTLFESFGFTDGEITLSAGADEVVVQFGDQKLRLIVLNLLNLLKTG